MSCRSTASAILPRPPIGLGCHRLADRRCRREAWRWSLARTGKVPELAPKFSKLTMKKKRSADFLNKGYFMVEIVDLLQNAALAHAQDQFRNQMQLPILKKEICCHVCTRHSSDNSRIFACMQGTTFLSKLIWILRSTCRAYQRGKDGRSAYGRGLCYGKHAHEILACTACSIGTAASEAKRKGFASK
jgi:hypothetical protein